MRKKWTRTLSLLSSLLLIYAGALSAADTELSFQKNRVIRDSSPMPVNTALPTILPGQVLGTHPFFAKLSVKIYQKNGTEYQEVTTPIGNIKPGMILDLPLYESASRTQPVSLDNTELPKPSATDSYFWSDWDKGDRDVLPEDADLQWYVLTLKDEYLAPNAMTCNLLGLNNVNFTAQDSNSARWTKLEKAAELAGANLIDTRQPKVLQNTSNTPWGNCFTATELNDHPESSDPSLASIFNTLSPYSIVIPALRPEQRLGFSITPDSLLGFPQKGYKAFVWDISQIWAQQAPIKTENRVTGQIGGDTENQFADIQVVFPEYEETNKDMSLPIGKHPIIGSPQVIPFDGQYRIRIFDKEYYEANKNNLDDTYDLSKLTKNTVPTDTNSQYKGFYVGRQYVALIEILNNQTFTVRPLTRSEVDYVPLREDFPVEDYPELPTHNVYWQLEWEDTNEKYIASDVNSIEDDKPYTIIYDYLREKQEVEPKVIVTYRKDSSNNETDEVEYIQFNAQFNNFSRVNDLTVGGENPELSEQSFKATVNFIIDEGVDTSALSTYQIESVDDFLPLGGADKN